MWPPLVATATGCIHTVAPGEEKIEMEKRMGCREMREREREAEMVSGETERERVKKNGREMEKNENRT